MGSLARQVERPASVLIEMGELVRQVPKAGATRAELAGWYQRKARLLEHIAADAGAEAGGAAEQARRAHQHATELVEAAGRPNGTTVSGDRRPRGR